jgi:nitroreductase
MTGELMNARMSVRVFTEDPVDDSIIVEMLDAARKAPSGGNEQQYVFGIIKDRNTIEEISNCSYGQKWIRGAPLIIALCTKVKDDASGAREIQLQRFPRYKSDIEGMDKGLYTCLNLEEHQTKIPGTIMTLLAIEHDVHSTWISRYDVLRVKELLRLPDNIYPCELIAFGYRKNAQTAPKKKSLDEIVFRETYGE